MVTKFNIWLDEMKNPKRFVVLTSLLFGWIIPTVIAGYFNVPSDFSNVASFIATWSALILFFVAVAVAAARMMPQGDFDA